MGILSGFLSLRFRDFFNKDPGHWIKACVGVSISINATIPNPESHSHLPFLDIVTVTLNMADTVRILGCSSQVNNSINGQGSCTFSTVESEIPAFAAIDTACDSKNTSPVNMEGCVWEVLDKHTVLYKRNDYQEVIALFPEIN